MENKKKYRLKSIHRKILADTYTPVSIYLKIRDQFPHSLLLESSDYDARANNFSYICCNPIASISISNGNIDYNYHLQDLNHPKMETKLVQELQC